jgi:ABC-2 type transport system ATP-binding protein
MQGQGMRTVAISVAGLVKRYHGSDEATLSGLDLEVREGEIFGLLGPNGAGKTTTLSIVCGLLKATSGSVRVLGVDVARHPARIKHLLGFVPWTSRHQTLTAENLNSRMHGLSAPPEGGSPSCCRGRLEKSADRRVRPTGGMKRRANLAAGIIHGWASPGRADRRDRRPVARRIFENRAP